MFIDQGTNLRKMVLMQHQYLIDQLKKAGISQLYDGRDLEKATLSELEGEMRYINSQREGDVLV